jgi:predicted RNA-binding Zn ribbon-like protein
MQTVTTPPSFLFRGGHSALDFLNTVGWRLSDDPLEFLSDYPALVAWAEQAGLIDHRDRLRLLRHADTHPKAADAELRSARRLRELLYGLIAPLAVGRRPATDVLDRFTERVTEAADVRSLVLKNRSPRWTWGTRPYGSLEPVLAQIVWSTAELIESGAIAQVRQCAGDPCGWLFLDTSNGGRRRWCSMADCGNLAKVRRHRDRQRS